LEEIPLCCIFFFMEIELETFPQDYRFKDGDGYIRCPDCLVKEFEDEKR
jgi:hypothetical protein